MKIQYIFTLYTIYYIYKFIIKLKIHDINAYVFLNKKNNIIYKYICVYILKYVYLFNIYS